jgi:hypothetical protein
MLILSDVPMTEPAQDEFFKNLKQTIGTILNLSSEWNINITVGGLPKGRIFSMASNLGISICFTQSTGINIPWVGTPMISGVARGCSLLR